MKKVCLSFDDGLLDFYTNCFPILKKHNIVCNLNVVTGFCDGTVSTNKKYCSIEQIKEMQEYGIEVSIHSNSHLRNTTVEDLDISYNKLCNWVGKENVRGLVLPFNQPLNSEIVDWSKGKIKYLRTTYNRNNGIYELFYKILGSLKIINNSKKMARINSRIHKIDRLMIFNSIEFLKKNNVNFYIDIINFQRENSFTIFMFHSILTNDDELSTITYKEGAITTSQLEDLIIKLKQKEVVFVTNANLIKTV